jgi:hypothetical protein
VTAVDLSLLAELLTDEVGKRCADPSPVRDASETNVVDMNYEVDPQFAAAYVQSRILHALGRLRSADVPSGDVVNDALIVLGGFAHLQDRTAAVTA